MRAKAPYHLSFCRYNSAGFHYFSVMMCKTIHWFYPKRHVNVKILHDVYFPVNSNMRCQPENLNLLRGFRALVAE